MPKLLHYPLCPFSRSIRLMLAEAGQEVDLEEERPWEWRPEFVALNPAGTLPVYVLEDGRGIAGAYAISEYLAETTLSGNFQPFPGNEVERAEIRRLVDWFQAKFDAEVSGYLLQEKVYNRYQRKSTPPDTDLLKAARSNIRYHLAYIGHLTAHRNWLAGETLSFADLVAAAHLSAADYLGDVPWDDNLEAKDWYVRVKSRPSFRALLADRLPGLTPPEIYADLDF